MFLSIFSKKFFKNWPFDLKTGFNLKNRFFQTPDFIFAGSIAQNFLAAHVWLMVSTQISVLELGQSGNNRVIEDCWLFLHCC